LKAPSVDPPVSVAVVDVAEALIVVAVEVVVEAVLVEEDPGTEIKTIGLINSRMATPRNMDNRLHPHRPSLRHHMVNRHISNHNLLTVCPNRLLDIRSTLSSNKLSSAKVKHPPPSPSNSLSSKRLRSQIPSRLFHRAHISILYSWLRCNINNSSSSNNNTSSHSNNISKLNQLRVRHSRNPQRP
jgi:hypothetical protein